MADNDIKYLNSTDGSAKTIASKDVSGVYYERTLLGLWDGSAVQDVPGDATNGIKVQGSFWQTTQPVSGTFWQSTQPVSIASVPSHAVTNAGTFAVQVTSAPTTAVTGTFWQSTQPISAASLPLPSGASTAAKQPALGTAGTASADVITVQGIASMTALKVDGSGVTQPVSGTVTANAGTNLNTSALALDATLTGGTQKTLMYDGTNTIGTSTHPVQVSLANTATNATAVKVDGSGVTQPVSGTFWQSTQPVSGTFWQTTQPVSIATAPALVASSAVIGHVIVDTAPSTAVTNAGTFSVQVSSAPTTAVTGTFWQSTQPVSIATAPALVASSAIIGKVGIDQTTPGTTNAVQLTAGSATVGTVNLGTNGPDLTNTTSALATATTTTALQLAGSGSISVTITLASGSISSLIYQFEVSSDGTNWVIAPLHPCSTTNGMGGPLVSDTKSSLSTPVTYAGNVSGFSQFRVNFTTVTGSSPSLTIVQRATIAEFVPRPPVMAISARLSIATGSETSIVAAPGAGLSIYVTGIHGTNASGTATQVDIRDGTAGTIRYTYFLAANGGGFAENLTQPWKLAANAALTAQLGGSNQCYFTANYFVAP